MKSIYEKQEELLNIYLSLERRVAGVRFLCKKEDYEKCDAQRILYKMPYCVMVKSAVSGHNIKAVGENFGCYASARALGFVEPKESFLSGEDGYKFGIYKDLDTAKSSSQNIVLRNTKSYGVQLAPLGMFEEAPDLIILITNPYNMMRVIQAHTFGYGNANHFRMGGLQALCSETTACTLMTGNINISMLCSGTRNLCRWKEEELAIGIPYSRFENVLEGLRYTINPLERDIKKKAIKEKSEAVGENEIEIIFGQNYDDGLYELGKSGRR